MRLKILSCCILVLIAGTLTSCSPGYQSASLKPIYKTFSKEFSSSNCGPKVLLEVFKFYNIHTTEEELVKLSDTKNGVTSFLGLSKAARSKGLECIGAETDFDNLKKLIKDNQVIVHFSRNNHFVLIKEIKEKTVAMYNPALITNTHPDVPIHLFIGDWNGYALIFNRKLKI